MDVGLSLPLLGLLTLETLQVIGNVSRNGEMQTSLDMVSVEGESKIAFVSQVVCDIIILFNYTNQIIIVLLSNIFRSKIIDN